MRALSSLLIVGAGLAGARCAETLRAEGYDGKLVLVGDELLPPYERPALSKEYLAGTRSEHELLLRAPSSWAEREIDLRLGHRVVRVDPLHRRATTAGGEALGWDVLVLATGARPRLLPFPVPQGVFTLRTVDDVAKGSVPGPNARDISLSEGVHSIKCETATRVYSGRITIKAHTTLTIRCQDLH